MINPTVTFGVNSMEGSSGFPVSSLKNGNMATVIAIANNMAAAQVSTDSVMNCLTRALFTEPITLRIPTSRARLVERAVARFIKLMMAMKRIQAAIAENI